MSSSGDIRWISETWKWDATCDLILNLVVNSPDGNELYYTGHECSIIAI